MLSLVSDNGEILSGSEWDPKFSTESRMEGGEKWEKNPSARASVDSIRFDSKKTDYSSFWRIQLVDYMANRESFGRIPNLLYKYSNFKGLSRGLEQFSEIDAAEADLVFARRILSDAVQGVLVNPESLSTAEQFIEKLPSDIEISDCSVGVTAAGLVSLSWEFDESTANVVCTEDGLLSFNTYSNRGESVWGEKSLEHASFVLEAIRIA